MGGKTTKPKSRQYKKLQLHKKPSKKITTTGQKLTKHHKHNRSSKQQEPMEGGKSSNWMEPICRTLIQRNYQNFKQ